MNENKTFKLKFGEVLVQRKKQAKYLRIRVHPERGVSVTMPHFYSYTQALDFVAKKEEWIRKSLSKTSKIKSKYSIFTHSTEFKTGNHELAINKHNKPSLKYTVKSSLITVWYPEFVEIENDKVQNFIRHAITETLRFEAKKYLPDKTLELAKKWGISLGDIRVRNNKTRWGSCSGNNNISLNIQLMRLPDNLIEYVILHELAHVKHKNHSAGFWNYLEKICPSAKQLDKKLNDFHPIYW